VFLRRHVLPELTRVLKHVEKPLVLRRSMMWTAASQLCRVEPPPPPLTFVETALPIAIETTHSSPRITK
jgi:hypothetical protein